MAELTHITQEDVALDFAGQINAKLAKAGIKRAHFGIYDDGHQIAVGVDIDGRRVGELIRVGAPPETVDEMVQRFCEVSEIAAKQHMRRTSRRSRQNKALQFLVTG